METASHPLFKTFISTINVTTNFILLEITSYNTITSNVLLSRTQAASKVKQMITKTKMKDFARQIKNITCMLTLSKAQT